MKRTLAYGWILYFIFSGCVSLVQAESPAALLNQYNVSLREVTRLFFDDPEHLSFRVHHSVTMTGESEKDEKDGEIKTRKETRVFEVNPLKPDGKRAQLMEVDGAPPTGKQLEEFDEVYNDGDSGETPENVFLPETLKIIETNENSVIAEVDFDPGKLKGDNRDLIHSRARIIIDTSAGQLRKIEVKAFETFRKMMVAKVMEFNVELWVRKHPEFQEYVSEKSRLWVKTRALGQDITVEEISVFDDYRKVKP
ncbi:MAG TPA: hypothetical protein PLV45_18520 [bacterium]|nr:hypothetical protein [bacterium]